MVQLDPEMSPADRGEPVHEGDVTHPNPTIADPPLLGFKRLLIYAIAAGLAAGAASWFAGETVLASYQRDLFPPLKISPTVEDMRRLREARLYSATLSFAAMGGLLGLAMGLAGGLARRSASASAQAAILGLLLGTATAAPIAFVLVTVFFKQHDPQSVDLVLPLLTHGAIWSGVGVIGGLAFGLGLGGRGRWKATLVGGFAGAAAATVVYEIVGALAFASNKTDLPLSASVTTRGMAQLLVALLSAVGAALALRRFAKTEASPPVFS
jgi:hypothetical protein